MDSLLGCYKHLVVLYDPLLHVDSQYDDPMLDQHLWLHLQWPSTHCHSDCLLHILLISLQIHLSTTEGLADQ
jgi:hypothetical protein